MTAGRPSRAGRAWLSPRRVPPLRPLDLAADRHRQPGPDVPTGMMRHDHDAEHGMGEQAVAAAPAHLAVAERQKLAGDVMKAAHRSSHSKVAAPGEFSSA